MAQLAERTKRSQSVLVAEAIEEFVSVQEWQIAGIEEALTSLDRGERLAHEDVKTWAATLGSKDRRPKPKSE